MNFSELFKQTNQLSRFSPNGKYLVSFRERTSFDLVHAALTNFFFRYQGSCVQYRLLVRDVKTLQILQLYTCLDVVQHVEVKFEFIRAEAQSM